VNTATLSPARCTWMRAPSSFHSTAAGLIRSKASWMVGAVWASIGWSGRPTSRRNRRRPALPSVSAASATAPSEPRSISARRTSLAGTPAARAVASTITPSSAPWRSSPPSSRIRKRCSPSVARPNRPASSRRRSAWEPGPDCRPISSKARSTSSSSSDGSAAGGGRSRSDAQPTPIWRWRSSPDRKATATTTSSGPRRRRVAASRSTLARRAGVAATASEVSTISASSTTSIVPARGDKARWSLSGRARDRSRESRGSRQSWRPARLMPKVLIRR
jgi:hypothetical protein